MLDLPFFFLGPLGELMPMACPETGVSSQLVAAGDVKQAINGRNTHDITSYRRVWGMQEAWLDGNDVSFLETMLATSHDRPLRLIDPLIVNRARLFASMTSNFAGYAKVRHGWAVDAGANPTFPMTDWPAVTFTSQGDARAMSYGAARHVLWTLSVGATLYVNGPNAVNVNLRDVDAVRPSEILTMSAWIRTTGSATVALGINGISSTGAQTTSATSSYAGSVGSWTRRTVTYTVPAGGTVGIFPLFDTNSTSGTIEIAGIQINSGSTALPFVRGGGCTEVLISGVSSVSPRFPLSTVDIELMEV